MLAVLIEKQQLNFLHIVALEIILCPSEETYVAQPACSGTLWLVSSGMKTV